MVFENLKSSDFGNLEVMICCKSGILEICKFIDFINLRNSNFGNFEVMTFQTERDVPLRKEWRGGVEYSIIGVVSFSRDT
jgi:hypothetical protein